MTRVALYARYSDDNQSAASIEDQFRICREHATRERWTVNDTYQDAGISGASVILRPGIQTLLQDAQRGKFDLVPAEALDRVSRDQADVATLFKHLRFAGRYRAARAERSYRQAGLSRSGRERGASLCRRDQSSESRAPRRGGDRPPRSGKGRARHQRDYGGDRGRHVSAGHEGAHGRTGAAESRNRGASWRSLSRYAGHPSEHRGTLSGQGHASCRNADGTGCQ